MCIGKISWQQATTKHNKVETLSIIFELNFTLSAFCFCLQLCWWYILIFSLAKCLLVEEKYTVVPVSTTDVVFTLLNNKYLLHANRCNQSLRHRSYNRKNKANLRDLIAVMTFKNNRAPLLCYFKLCASFRSHWLIQTGVTVQKRLIWVKIDDYFSRVTLKFDVWPWKTIGHLFYATSSFVYHFLAIGEFKLEPQSGNAQSGSNSTLFRAVWPWNLTDDLWQQ